ncbi:hypothetical protein H5410_057120 [Solanum commersonii]|uniref:Uncharacterized protein n=1 Tax=Solanum commersonii TaxID=4109 RepID=A0A9J5WN67_SOLCO|nr:hypothetical protein H5410_057120 [Solanum commersonii]
MNIIKKKSTVKNSRKEKYDITQHLDLLNKWTIPNISRRTIYQMGTFEKLGLKQVGYLSIYAYQFSTCSFQAPYYAWSTRKFIAALRDGRNHNCSTNFYTKFWSKLLSKALERKAIKR